MSPPRRLARNEARLVRCSAGCGVLVWLAGALPVASDATFVCRACTRAAEAELEADARARSMAEVVEDGPWIGANIAVLARYAAGVRREHGQCGPLELKRDEHGASIGITCPEHGFLPAPERTRAASIEVRNA